MSKPISFEERKTILSKMAHLTPLTWEECDRLLDHIECLEETLKSSGLEVPGELL